MPTQAKKTPTDNILSYALLGVTAFLLTVGGVLGWLYFKDSERTPEQLASEKSVEEVTSEVSKLIDVPDEEPSIATIVDIEKLKAQSPKFYSAAEDGDKLLVYSDRVILYDVSRGIILNMVLTDTTSLVESANSQSGDQGTDEPVPEVSSEK